jgi:hypothetical protein
MLAVCIWIKCEERWLEEGLNTSRLVIWLFLVGSIMGIAVSIKITSSIPIIAFLLCGFLNRNDDKKPGIKKFLNSLYWGIVPVVMICVFLLLNWYSTTLPCEAYRDSYGTPKVSYWVGIGIKGNGGYVDNQEYS